MVYNYVILIIGNLHLNILADSFNDTTKQRLEPFVYEYIQKLDGSISAEHGIGQMKPEKLFYSKSQPMIDVMQKIKSSLDPNGILNPGKVLPSK